MLKQWETIMTLSLIALLSLTAAAQNNVTDPYDILNRHFQANGGLERIKAERTQYVEGNVSVAGLQGTLKLWTQKPDRSRSEVDLSVLRITQGNNGEYEWVLDSNGKLQKITKKDEAATKRKEVKRRLAEFEYADPQSKLFKVEYVGTESVDDKVCHVLRVVNNVNSDAGISYINTNTFLLEKSISVEGEDSTDTYYSDYRPVEGLMVAFAVKEIPRQTGQTQEVVVTKYVSNPQIDPMLFEPPEQVAKDYQFANGKSSENVPFKFIESHIFVKVKVGDQEAYWILDTGAGMSVISEAFAKSLGLKLEGALKGKGAGGTVDIKLANLPPFSIRGMQFKGQTVAVMDMTELNRLFGVESAGILGFDFLSRLVTKVDYANELISFYEPDSFVYRGDGHKADVHIKDNIFSVKATLDGKHSGTWVFDMGAGTTSLHGAFALREGFTKMKGVERMGRGAGAYFNTKRVRGSSLEFAGFKVDNPLISFSYGGSDTKFAADEIGILGNSLFQHFVIYCDYAREELIVEKGANFNKEFPEDRSGMQLIYGDGDTLSVLFVADGTPAATGGFKEKDVIKSIDGVDVGKLGGLNAIREMLKKEGGTQYTFVVNREGTEKKLTLTLAELL